MLWSIIVGGFIGFVAGRITKKAQDVYKRQATIRMTVRGRTVDDLEGIILPAIKEAAQEIAASYGARVEMHHYEPLFKDCLLYTSC